MLFKMLNSSGFKSIMVGLARHDSLYNDTHLVAKDLVKLNNRINTGLISPNINIYHF